MVIFLGFVLAAVALALAVGISIHHVTVYGYRVRGPRKSRLTYEQYEEMKTWGTVGETES